MTLPSETPPPATDDALRTLPALVQKQRRLLAGHLRIVREEKQAREDIAALLDAAGVSQTTCDGFTIYVVERGGRRYAVVNPIK